MESTPSRASSSGKSCHAGSPSQEPAVPTDLRTEPMSCHPPVLQALARRADGASLGIISKSTEAQQDLE